MSRNGYNIYEKIDIIEEYLSENKEDINVHTKYKDEPIGMWLNQIRSDYNKGLIPQEAIDRLNKRNLLDAKRASSEKRVSQVINFVNKYPELWYNQKNFNEKLAAITNNGEEREAIIKEYKTAEENYESLRRNKRQLPEDFKKRLAEAGVGRAFGFSRGNIEEEKILIEKYGMGDGVAKYIIKHYGGIELFKQAYCNSLKNGTVSQEIPEIILKETNLVTYFDLAEDDFVYRGKEGYIKLIKELFGKKLIIIDSTEFIEKISNIIENIGNGAEADSRVKSFDREKSMLRSLFGLDGEDIKTYREISEQQGSSHARAQQIGSRAINRIKEHKKDFRECVFNIDEESKKRFADIYFQNHSVFFGDSIEPLDKETKDSLLVEITYGQLLEYIEQYEKEFLLGNKLTKTKRKMKRHEYDLSYTDKSEDADFIKKAEQTATDLLEKIDNEIEKNKFLSDEAKEQLYKKLGNNSSYIQMLLEEKCFKNIDNQKEEVSFYYSKTKKIIEGSLDNRYKLQFANQLEKKIEEISNQNILYIESEIQNNENEEEPCLFRSTKLEDMGFSQGTINCLKRILGTRPHTIGELIRFSSELNEPIWKTMKGFGTKRIEDLEETLKRFGLKLEDTDKSEETHRQNNLIMEGYAKNNDAEKLYRYKKIKQKIAQLYLTSKHQQEIDEKIDMIVSCIDMDSVKKEEKAFIISKINQLGKVVTFESNINELNLPKGIVSCLNKNGIYTICDLCKKSSSEVQDYKGLGEKKFNSILQAMGSLGLHFSGEEVPQVQSGYYRENGIKLNETGVREIKLIIESSYLQEDEKLELLRMLDNTIHKYKDERNGEIENKEDEQINYNQIFELKLEDLKRAYYEEKLEKMELNEKKKSLKQKIKELSGNIENNRPKEDADPAEL